MSQGLVDNDVLHKTACYGLASLILKHVPLSISEYSILGAAKYVVRNMLKRRPPKRGTDAVLGEFEQTIHTFSVLEPTEEEIRLAAELESMAQGLNVSLDTGESQLCAVATLRGDGYIFTGDKRAISAIDILITNGAALSADERLVCLEQLFVWMLRSEDIEPIRHAVCMDRDIDTALFTCLSCHSETASREACEEGLGSYINHLRQSAPRTLLPDP